MKSLSEIETTSKRASRAAGFSWGIAEEVGKSVRLLELFGFSGIKNLNQYYQNKRKENFEKLKLIKANNESSKFNYCPIILGVSFIDQIKLFSSANASHIPSLMIFSTTLTSLSTLATGASLLGKARSLALTIEIISAICFSISVIKTAFPCITAKSISALSA